MENIEHIEVIKGASSVLSGTSALSGAIHIMTTYFDLFPKDGDSGGRGEEEKEEAGY